MLRIGHDASFEPFAMVENGRSTGLVLDAVAEAMQRMKAPFVFVLLTLDAAEPALAEGKVDALAAKGDTAERRVRFDFSAPIVVTGGALFARAGTPAAKRLADFAGKVVVTPRRGPLFAQIAKSAPEVTLREARSYAESLALVLAGEADAAALNWHVGIRMARAKHPGKFALPNEPYIALPLALAVAKGTHADVLKRFDAELAAMKSDGTLKAIEERWLGR
jgi:ABC-type amino acid transport substrate-binding protein